MQSSRASKTANGSRAGAARASVVLLAKDHAWGRTAAAWVRALFPDADIRLGTPGTDFPRDIGFRPDSRMRQADRADGGMEQVLLSFLSPWIVPQEALDRFSLALNFHPGPREYPGTGCYNFALYEGAREYGCTTCWRVWTVAHSWPSGASRLHRRKR